MGNDDDIIIRHKLVAAVKAALVKIDHLPVWALIVAFVMGVIVGAWFF